MRIVGIRYNTKEGPKTMTYFNDSLKRLADLPEKSPTNSDRY